MRGYVIAGLAAAALLAPSIASAQDISTSFRGFRLEGNVGADRFKAEGDHRTKFGYGGSGGFDGVIADKIVIGPEGSYWRANKGGEDCATINGGVLCQHSSYEIGAAVRAGYLITPSILVFGKGGYVHSRQRNSFNSGSGLYYVDGRIVGPGYSASQREGTDGYQVGGGAELSLTSMVYVSGQYVYSRYDNHTSRQRAMFGAGLRFK